MSFRSRLQRLVHEPPASLAGRLGRTVQGLRWCSGPTGAVSGLTDANLGELTWSYVERGIRDFCLIDDNAGMSLEVVWNDRHSGARHRLPGWCSLLRQVTTKLFLRPSG